MHPCVFEYCNTIFIERTGQLLLLGEGDSEGVVVCRCGASGVGVRLVCVCAHCGEKVCGVNGCLRQCQVCQEKLCHLCTI